MRLVIHAVIHAVSQSYVVRPQLELPIEHKLLNEFVPS